jgi:hypothetical protein
MQILVNSGQQEARFTFALAMELKIEARKDNLAEKFMRVYGSFVKKSLSVGKFY